MKKNKETNLCLECPVRGHCCYYSVEIEGYNLILWNQPCKYLDKETGLCTTYETRFETGYCNEISSYGALPKECLYLIDNPKLESFHKIDVRKIAGDLSQKSLLEYNVLNNMNMNDIREYCKRSEE